jgi:hypothetical protein
MAAKKPHSKQISYQRNLTAKKSRSKEVSQQRNLTPKKSHTKEISYQRNLTAKKFHSKEISHQRNLIPKKSHSKDGSHESFVSQAEVAVFEVKSCTKASFSQLQLAVFEGTRTKCVLQEKNVPLKMDGVRSAKRRL